VCAWYDTTQALFGVDIAVRAGEVLALVGANGAGKTTTIRSILGLTRTTGTIEIDGKNISTWPTHSRVNRCGIATVHESRSLFGELTVLENLQLGSKRGPSLVPDEIADLFPIVKNRANSPVATLSGGERQMVALARSIMRNPRLVLLDEPTLGLAPIVSDAIYEQIVLLSRQGIAVLLIEQSINRALTVANRLQLISVGRTHDSIDSKDIEKVRNLEAQVLSATTFRTAPMSEAEVQNES